jgi:hypothetical protein
LLVLVGCADRIGDIAEEPDQITTARQAAQRAPSASSTGLNKSADAPDVDADIGDEEPVIPGIVAWWTRADKLFDFEFPGQEMATLSDRLSNLELSYQLAQSQLRQARREQVRMLEDPAIADAEIERLHRERLQAASAAMLQANFSARLWARKHLTEDQLAAILKAYPTFFRVRWFRTPRGPVVQGQVEPERKGVQK